MSSAGDVSLQAVIARDCTAVAALAAAERAVEEGRLNMAKVLRALALAARARAFSLQRVASAGAPASDLFAELRSQYATSTGALAALAPDGPSESREPTMPADR